MAEYLSLSGAEQWLPNVDIIILFPLIPINLCGMGPGSL